MTVLGAGLLALVAAATPPGPTVTIDVTRGPKPVTLIAREATRAEVRGLGGRSPMGPGVCTSPCEQVVAVDGAPGFFIAGPGVLPSSTFDLPPRGDVQLEVRAGRRAGFLAGWVLAGVGAPTLLTGATLMTFADDDRGRLRTGAVVAGAGAAVLITGAVLVATGRTRVRVVPKR
ncbi:MAG: hypothetical protein AAGA54_34825 [Myxococcota bacterium]